ncbi:hypothetical protein B9Z55_027972 [Caenorhabditis nigoni]|uniref:Uncharacterized protein n=1 Tax=Caenorhabditis nigoni TaxID=1611254 RepID=A0A2G5SDY7_9PELO|nr:hypothetical protein B9Z55_027972 [Caenorhabditis nigoni]
MLQILSGRFRSAEGNKNLEIEETMAAMSLFWEEMKSQAARGADAACHIEDVSASVASEEVASYRAQLEKKKIYAKAVDSKGCSVPLDDTSMLSWMR